MMDLHPFSVRYSPFITSKRFSKYSRLILSGFVNGNREIRDVKSELDLGVSSVGMEPLIKRGFNINTPVADIPTIAYLLLIVLRSSPFWKAKH